MYIEPNTVIKIYKNVPLDNTYNHTLYFDSVSAQNSYFHSGTSGIIKYTFSKQSYQRVNKGKMRVEQSAENLYDCNYLAFQNSSFGSKWFYAFITSVEYVNNVTSEITFEIDVIQTYLFDVTLKDSFVEREHSSTDTIGGNIVEENVSCGPYIQNGNSKKVFDDSLLPATNYYIVLASTVYNSGTEEAPIVTDKAGTVVSGLYQGCNFMAFTPTIEGCPTLSLFIEKVIEAGKEDSLVALFVCPKTLYDACSGLTAGEDTKDLGNMLGTTIGGYTPKNKKLFTYPYNYLCASDGNGANVIYKFEYFDDPTDIKFNRLYQLSCSPMETCAPLNYINTFNYDPTLTNLNVGDLDYAITLDNFPQCSMSIDAYKAWLAQNKYNLIGWGAGATSNAFTSAIGAIGSASAGSTGSGVSSLVSNMNSVVHDAIGWVTKDAIAQIQGDRVAGTPATNNNSFTHNCYDVFISRKSITSQYARIIDDYFTMYGYATKRVKVPNRNVRPHWTYTKTLGCVVEGNAPADDVRKICSIYDNGITFWKSASEVGNYSLDNSPT